MSSPVSGTCSVSNCVRAEHQQDSSCSVPLKTAAHLYISHHVLFGLKVKSLSLKHCECAILVGEENKIYYTLKKRLNTLYV